MRKRILLSVIAGARIVFAGSISSDAVNNFMQLPAWMPSSVSADDTFGSPDRTNASHRVTEKTLAAAVAAFDALYERAYYSSEGRSNGWDVAEYGPREPCAEMMTNHVRSLFQYKSWDTNGVPLVAPGTRRLVDFENVGEFYDKAFREAVTENHGGVTLLDRGTNWNSDARSVFFACTNTPGLVDPALYTSWSVNGIDIADDGSNLMTYQQNFIPLMSARLGDLDPGAAPPSVDELPSARFCSQFMFGTSDHLNAAGWPASFTLDEVFANALGCSSNLAYDVMGEPHSRRLLPDERETVDTSVEEEYLGSMDASWTDRSSEELMSWQPWFDLPASSYGGGYLSFVYGDYETRIPVSEDGVFRADVAAVTEGEDEVRRELELFSEYAADMEADTAVIPNYEVAYFSSFADSEGVVTNGSWDVVYPEFTVDFYRHVIVTNSITTNVSVLATMGREMAVMNRTYEVVPHHSKADPVDEDTLLRVESTYAYGSGGYLDSPTNFIRGKLHVLSHDPLSVEWKKEGDGPILLFPPSEVTQPMAIANSVTTNNYVDTRTDRIRFHGARLSAGFDFVGTHNASLVNTSPFSLGGEYEVSDGLYHAESALTYGVDKVTVSVTFMDRIIGLVDVSHANIEDTVFAVPVFSRLIVDGSYSLDATEEMTIEKVERAYGFMGPSKRAFNSGRVVGNFCRSYGGLGYFEDFALLNNGTMSDRPITSEIPYDDYIVGMELVYEDDSEPMERMRAHYKSSDTIQKVFASENILPLILEDRKITRDAAFSAVSSRIGCDVNNPSDVLDFSGSANPVTTELSVFESRELDVDVSRDEVYLVEVKDKSITHVYAVRSYDQHHSTTEEVSSVRLEISVGTVKAWDLIESYHPEPRLSDFAGRAPCHADGKSGRISWTDWNWKALKMSTVKSNPQTSE